jgi:HPt (histidine-containing phosphotransfer) domain-containing protein
MSVQYPRPCAPPVNQVDSMTSRTSPPHVTPAGNGGPRPGFGHAPDDTVLDVQALERLRELDPGGRNNLVARILEAFTGSVAKLQPQLEQARRDADLKTIRHVAHTLKSSSASIGAVRLSPLCAEVEALARDERGDVIGPRVDALVIEIGHVLNAIRAQQEAQA